MLHPRLPNTLVRNGSSNTSRENASGGGTGGGGTRGSFGTRRYNARGGKVGDYVWLHTHTLTHTLSLSLSARGSPHFRCIMYHVSRPLLTSNVSHAHTHSPSVPRGFRQANATTAAANGDGANASNGGAPPLRQRLAERVVPRKGKPNDSAPVSAVDQHKGQHGDEHVHFGGADGATQATPAVEGDGGKSTSRGKRRGRQQRPPTQDADGEEHRSITSSVSPTAAIKMQHFGEARGDTFEDVVGAGVPSTPKASVRTRRPTPAAAGEQGAARAATGTKSGAGETKERKTLAGRLAKTSGASGERGGGGGAAAAAAAPARGGDRTGDATAASANKGRERSKREPRKRERGGDRRQRPRTLRRVHSHCGDSFIEVHPDTKDEDLHPVHDLTLGGQRRQKHPCVATLRACQPLCVCVCVCVCMCVCVCVCVCVCGRMRSLLWVNVLHAPIFGAPYTRVS